MFLPVGKTTPAEKVEITDDPLPQEQLWAVVSRALEPGNVVIAEQGTSVPVEKSAEELKEILDRLEETTSK